MSASFGYNLVSATLSRAFILFFCSCSSSSTLKKPAQWSTTERTEIIEAKEGILCFTTAMILGDINLLFPNVNGIQTDSAGYVILGSRVWVTCQMVCYCCHARQNFVERNINIHRSARHTWMNNNSLQNTNALPLFLVETLCPYCVVASSVGKCLSQQYSFASKMKS